MEKEEALKVWLEESRMLWSRLQTVTAVEIATLGSWYFFYDKPNWLFEIATIAIGTVIMLLMYLLMRRDVQYMEACEKIEGVKVPNLEDAWCGFKGRKIASWIPWALILTNVVALIMTLSRLRFC